MGMVISTHLPPPVMIDSTAARQCVTHILCWTCCLIQNGSRAFYVITGEQIRAAAAFLDGPNLNLQNVQNFPCLQ
jgi:hypothetical protein